MGIPFPGSRIVITIFRVVKLMSFVSFRKLSLVAVTLKIDCILVSADIATICDIYVYFKCMKTVEW